MNNSDEIRNELITRSKKGKGFTKIKHPNHDVKRLNLSDNGIDDVYLKNLLVLPGFSEIEELDLSKIK